MGSFIKTLFYCIIALFGPINDFSRKKKYFSYWWYGSVAFNKSKIRWKLLLLQSAKSVSNYPGRVCIQLPRVAVSNSLRCCLYLPLSRTIYPCLQLPQSPPTHWIPRLLPLFTDIFLFVGTPHHWSQKKQNPKNPKWGFLLLYTFVCLSTLAQPKLVIANAWNFAHTLPVRLGKTVFFVFRSKFVFL